MSRKSLKLKISARLLKKKTRRRKGAFAGSKQCRFCTNKEQLAVLDYKNTHLLRNFLTERGKILPSRISGTCARHQRMVSHEIKRSRIMALMPYTPVSF